MYESLTPEQQAGVDKVWKILARSALKRYQTLFPDYPLPDFEAFQTWLTDLEVTFTEFAFYMPQPKHEAFLLRAIASGPVGGWRVRDEANPDSPEGRPLTTGELEHMVAIVRAAIDAAHPKPRSRRKNGQT